MSEKDAVPNNLYYLDDYRPYVVVDAKKFGGKVHALPLAYLQDWIAGKRGVRAPPISVLRAFVAQGLAQYAEGSPDDDDNPA